MVVPWVFHEGFRKGNPTCTRLVECIDECDIPVPRWSGGHALTEASTVAEKQRMGTLDVGCAVDKNPAQVVQSVSVDGRRVFEMVDAFCW